MFIFLAICHKIAPKNLAYRKKNSKILDEITKNFKLKKNLR